MKPKLDIPTKLNSLFLIVVFAIILLPTCKKNEERTSLFEKWSNDANQSHMLTGAKSVWQFLA